MDTPRPSPRTKWTRLGPAALPRPPLRATAAAARARARRRAAPRRAADRARALCQLGFSTAPRVAIVYMLVTPSPLFHLPVPLLYTPSPLFERERARVCGFPYAQETFVERQRALNPASQTPLPY